jgi:hypothetical protein
MAASIFSAAAKLEGDCRRGGEGDCGGGDAYFSGEGEAQDYGEAVRWFRKAADAGNTLAQVSLGDAYHDGKGVPQDYAEAVRWFRRAADAGDFAASFPSVLRTVTAKACHRTTY